MRALRAVVQAIIAAIVLLECIGPGITPAEARFMAAAKYVLINNATDEPQKTMSFSNTFGGFIVKRLLNGLLIGIEISRSWRPAEPLVHSVRHVSFGGH